MGRSKRSCLKIITCARGDSVEDDDRAASPEYWFCEHIDVIAPRESMEKETLRTVRWELHDLNSFLDNHDLASIDQANNKVSSDKRRWSFRKRSPGHQKQGSTLISEPVCVSYNKENSDVTASNFHSPKSSSVSEKALIKDTLNDTPPVASVIAKSEPIAMLVPRGNSNVIDHNIQEPVVVIIQAFIRGYLVRSELPKLKNAIKLQAAVRGHLVRRQAVGTLRCAQAIIKMQALIRARRARMHSKKLEVDEEVEKFQMDMQSPATMGERNSCMKQRYNSTKVILSNGFARQLLECTPKTMPIYINRDPSKSNSTWKWLERWMTVIVSARQEQEQNLQSFGGQEKYSKTLDFEAENDDTFAVLSMSSDSKLLPCESAVPTEDNMHLITKTSGEFEFYDPTYIPENSVNTLMKDDQDKLLLHNEIICLKPEKDTEVKAYNEKFISPLNQRPLQTDTTSELVQVSISDKPESDSNLENYNRMAVREAWVDEEKELVAGPKRCNLIISAGQSKFEDLISSSTVGKTIDCSQDATADSRLDDSHFQFDSSTKVKDHILPENSVHDSRVQDAASECGTEISISSTLDSPDRSEGDGEIILEVGSLEKQKNDANGGSDVSFNPENTEAKSPSFHQKPFQTERLEECDQTPGDSFMSFGAAQSKQQSAEPGITDMQSQAESSIHQQIDRSSLEGTPRSHTIAPELHGTPSSQNSVNAKKIGKESRKPDGKLISQIGKRSPSNSTKNSGERSSMEQLKKDSKNAMRLNSLGTAIPDYVDEEPRISTSSSSLPSYMQATESARAKAHASISPKASPDLHNKDNHMKKRHSLPIANGKPVSSPRMKRSTSEAHRSPKSNDIHSPHNSAERRWQR